MAEDLGDKTEPASPKRREEAHKDGSMPRSTDLTASITLAGAVFLLLWQAPHLMEGLGVTVRQFLSGDFSDNGAGGSNLPHDLAAGLWSMLRIMGPYLGLIAAVAAIGSLIQVGFMLTGKPLMPSLSRLNPMNGLGRLFGMQSVGRTGMSFGKVGIVFLVCVILISNHFREIMMLPHFDYAQVTVLSGRMLMQLCIWLAILLFLLGIADFAFQKWQWERDNRMTKHEVKEEMRQTIGDPMIKQRQRQFGRRLLSQRLKQAVPAADVVVTNPEHLAIALKWDPESMTAPIVVAKGADYVALRIRQIAIAHGVPMVERKPLARAMYPAVHVGQEIPPRFFQAVAEILAYVYRLNGKKAA